MQVRTYRARSLKEALQRVQQELGPETRIVQTRELHTGWWDRFAHGRQFEIRAHHPGPQPLPLRRRDGATSRSAGPTTATRDLDQHVQEFRQRVRESLRHDPPVTITGNTDRSQVHPLPADDVASSWFGALNELIEADVPDSVARQLVNSARRTCSDRVIDLAAQRRALYDQLADRITTCGPIQPVGGSRRTVALVGPSGVGKTTTIAKLAANLRLRDGHRVGLVTVDTFRVAAVDQLRTYAQIMDLPMEVVATPREMNAALAKLADQDIVLIDTAGNSPRDAVQLQQLKSLLAEAHADQIQLVVSAVSASSHLRQILQRFAVLGLSALTITRLDETLGLGHLLPVLDEARLPVGYLTCGQHVPDDIRVAEQQSLLQVLLGQQPVSLLSGVDWPAHETA